MRGLTKFFILLLFVSCSPTIDSDKTVRLFPIIEFGQWGYINSEGKTVIQCQYDDARLFTEGLAAVSVDSLWGFIDATGKMVIEPRFEEVTQFSDGLCNVTFKSDSGTVNAFIKTDGSIAFTTKYQYISPFAYDRATVEINDEVCVIDKSGKIVFNTHYPYGGGHPLQDSVVQVWGGKAGWVQEGLSQVWRGDTTRYYDIDGKLLLELEGMAFSNFNDGLALVRINDNACFINKKGEIKIKLERPELTYFVFSDGLAEVVIPGADHSSGFVDKTGKIVIPIQYDLVNDFKEGLAAFADKDGWGFINKEGEVIIKPQFEQVHYNGFSNGLCLVEQNGLMAYIDKSGEFIWREKTDNQ